MDHHRSQGVTGLTGRATSPRDRVLAQNAKVLSRTRLRRTEMDGHRTDLNHGPASVLREPAGEVLGDRRP